MGRLFMQCFYFMEVFVGKFFDAKVVFSAAAASVVVVVGAMLVSKIPSSVPGAKTVKAVAAAAAS
jgi:hypothetical protein